MAEITPEGYSFHDKTLIDNAFVAIFPANALNICDHNAKPQGSLKVPPEVGPLSDRSPKPGWAQEFIGDPLLIYMNPIFITPYCPGDGGGGGGSVRPATGQVYPRGYS